MYDFSFKLYEKDNSTLVDPPTGGILAKDLFREGKVLIELNGQEEIDVEVDHKHAEFQYLTLSRILELTHTDQNLTKRFRITRLHDVRRNENTYAQLFALGLKFDLSDFRHNFHGSLIQQAPTTHLTQVLTGSGFTVGTVTPTNTFTLDYSYNKILDDLYRIREKVNESGTEYDIVVNDDKTVDFVIAGNQSSTSTIEFKKNLLTLNRAQSRPKANRIFAIGGASQDGVPMTVRNARFRITQINTVGPNDDLVLDSDEILLADDSLNGFKVEAIDPEEATLISDSAKGGGNDKVTIPTPPGGTFSVGDFVRFRDPAPITLAPQNLNFIQDTGSINTHGTIDDIFRDESFQDFENLLRPYEKSALSGTYTAGLCEGWSKVGTDVTVAENTDADFVLNGTKSQKVTVAGLILTPGAPTVAVQSPLDGNLNGSYTYQTCYFTKDGFGPLSTASASVAPANEVVKVDLNDSGHTGRDEILGWAIFRKKTTDAAYYKIALMSDFTASYYDTIGDGILQEEYPGATAGPGGQGIEATFTATVGKRYSCLVNLWVSGSPYGQVRVELDVGTITPEDGAEQSKIATTVVTSDQRFVIAIGGVTAQSASGKLRVVAHQGQAIYYVDSVMVTETDVPPPIDQFIAESSGAELWKAAYRYAQGKGEVQKEIEASIHDLYAINDTDEFQIGDQISIIDSDLSVNESVRIPRKQFNLRKAWQGDYDLSLKKPVIEQTLLNIKKSVDKVATGASKFGSRELNTKGSQQRGVQVWTAV